MSPPKAVARLEARIDQDLHDQIQKAAKLSHTTLTAFVTEVLRKASQQVIEQHGWMVLTRNDQERFAKALLSSPKTTPALERAFKNRRRLLTSE